MHKKVFARHDHFFENSKDQHLFLRLREVAPESDGRNAQAILFVHGAIMPSVLFDIPVQDASWLEFFAHRNFHAFALDLQGYGRSTKPPTMNLPEKEVAPLCTHEDALSNISDAIHYIQSRLHIHHVVLVGLSWGSVLAGSFTHRYPHLVSHLVLLGAVYSYPNPLWSILLDPTDPKKLISSLGGYRVISRDILSAAWNREIPEAFKDIWRTPSVYHAIEKEILQSDIEWAQKHNIEAIRVPCGVLQDVLHIYHENPLYPAEEISAPTLIIRGDHDLSSHPKDMENLFKKLGTPRKSYVQMGHTSHYAVAEHRAQEMMNMTFDFIQR